MPSILDVDVESIVLGKSVLLENARFSIDRPEITLLTGENGAGKSTLLKSIVGLIPHVYTKMKINGSIRICGYDPLTAIKKQLLSYVPQVPSSFFLGTTVIQELRLSNTPLDKAKEFKDILGYPIEWLSDGYKYRLLLKTGLSQRQRIMMVDEPSSYIDPWSIGYILKEMSKATSDYGTSFIIADHKREPYRDIVSGKIVLSGRKRKEKNNDKSKPEIPEIVQDTKLSLENTNFSYNKKKVLNDVGLEGIRGDRIVVLGKNGSGKTTLLKCAAGLLKCSGESNVKGRIFFIPHSRIRYFTKNTVMGEIAVHMHPRLDRSIVEDMIDFLGLREKLGVNPYNLSIGETRRLYFLLAIASGANIIVVDEVSLGLDEFYRKKIGYLIELFADSGGIVLASTHDMEFTRYFDKKLLLENGTLSEI